MPLIWLVGIICFIGLVGYFLGRQRALSSAGGKIRELHSLPVFYGLNVSAAAIFPALALLAIWLIVEPMVIQNRVATMIPDDVASSRGEMSLTMSEIRRVAEGLDSAIEQGLMTEEFAGNARADVADITQRLKDSGVVITQDVTVPVLRAAQAYREMSQVGTSLMNILVILASLAGFAVSFAMTNKDFRARNVVENGTLLILLGAACIAILTTIGIVLSLIFNTIEFFRIYPVTEFFFGTTWNPSFSGRGQLSQLGVIPLIWGTLYISFIALLVAVPIGLYAAIYLSEYASPRVRAIVKPALEVLAGIPTIVYGLFALLTVGPLLLDVFGPNGAGWMGGASSVMTAGLVMGIMLIPFVSSLSDDIINAVPQAMRDGSLGLGATQSETVRQVVLPAALPGIVGAIILAASRAIGETMIVVMGAGAAARLDLNPFEAMTTVTAKIVSQLTGDNEFTSPETLVAFALGMTLFVITLGLNILALRIVRKYQEQYE